MSSSHGDDDVGDTVTTEGTDFVPGSTVTVEYTDADGTVVATNEVTVGDDGTFTDTLVVPEGTAPGELVIEATGDDLTATDTVLVVDAGEDYAPVVEASPAEVAAGDTVTVAGSDYVPGSTVSVVYTDADGDVVATNEVTVGDDGTFTDSIVVPEAPHSVASP